MLIQQLRQTETDGIVCRIVHHQVPPKVEYCLTKWGQALCPALDALLKWAALREKMSDPQTDCFSAVEANGRPMARGAKSRFRPATRFSLTIRG
jgi:DNA-binding HxlR family transcriptional regulator